MATGMPAETMAEVGGHARMMGQGAVARAPYSHRFGDQTPDAMPEIARELLIMRGAAESVRQKVAHVEEQMEALITKVAPVTDRRDTIEKAITPPSVGDAERAAKRAATETEMVPRSDVGTDLRVISEELNSTTEYLERLGERLWTLTRDLTV